jgi:hypothetical protein
MYFALFKHWKSSLISELFFVLHHTFPQSIAKMIYAIGFAIVGVLAALLVASTTQAKKGKLGCCHLFKAKNTSSSQQTRVAHTATVVCDKPKNKNAIRRDAQKEMKLASLLQIAPLPHHAVDMEKLKGILLFFSGTVNQFVSNSPVPDSKTLLAVSDLKVVDTCKGA